MADEKELALMLNPDLLTALHYCAVITLTGAITSEYFLFRRGMSIDQVRKLLLADSLAALALLLIFITGLLLVLAHPQPPPPLLANPATAPSCCCSSSWPSASAAPAGCSIAGAAPTPGRAPIVSIPAAALGDLDPQGNLLLLALLPLLARLANADPRSACKMTGDKAPHTGIVDRITRGPP